MGIEEKKSEMDRAVEEAVKSVDEQMGGPYDRALDKKFLAHIRKQMKEREEIGKPLTHEDLSKGEQHRLRKIAELETDLTDEELNTLAALGSPKKKG